MTYKTYKTIARNGTAEEVIKKSRFICQLKRVYSEEEARSFIQTVKKEHYKANHNCSAFILGQSSQIKRSSDDGEPSGTAGIPMLGVLENMELTNVAAVVTRYFGGVKLGAGGLIRAYASSVAHALETVGRAEVKEQQGICLTLSYSQYQELAHFLKEHQLQEVSPLFTAQVQTEIFADPEELESIMADLKDFYQGKIKISKSDLREVEIPLI